MAYISSNEAIAPVAYYESHQLVEAGMSLLEGPRHIQLAVVRALGTASLFDLADNPDHTQGAIDTLYAAVPSMRRLDQAVNIWSAQRLPEPYQLRKLHSNGIKEGGIGLHYDDPGDCIERPGARYDGPLTMSLRVDQHAATERVFYALRTDSPALTTEGYDRSVEDALDKTCISGQLYPHVDMYAARQEPGDLILMRNYPYPTIHTVMDPSEETGIGITRALLATWRVEYTPPRDNDELKQLFDEFAW